MSARTRRPGGQKGNQNAALFSVPTIKVRMTITQAAYEKLTRFALAQPDGRATIGVAVSVLAEHYIQDEHPAVVLRKALCE